MPVARQMFRPPEGMEVFDDNNAPVQGSPQDLQGVVIKTYEEAPGWVSWRSHSGQRLRGKIPGLGEEAAPAGGAGVQQAPAGGGTQAISDVEPTGMGGTPVAPPSPAAPGGGGLLGKAKEKAKGFLGRGGSMNPKQADASSEAYEGRRPPAKNQLRFKIDKLVRRGDYLAATVVWDPDCCADMGPANVRHNVVSFIKQRATEKEFIDLGTIGKPRLLMCDPEAGVAEVLFRSSETRNFVPEYVSAEGDFYEPIA
jgi:hypothetical protein